MSATWFVVEVVQATPTPGLFINPRRQRDETAISSSYQAPLAPGTP
jgi:hypothetical protein